MIKKEIQEKLEQLGDELGYVDTQLRGYDDHIVRCFERVEIAFEELEKEIQKCI